ncbi:MAG: hypothetical protein GX139_10935 [Armatimonadetes bacterium]|nr:hypothetical protein [Armatimonadota bacterium]
MQGGVGGGTPQRGSGALAAYALHRAVVRASVVSPPNVALQPREERLTSAY